MKIITALGNPVTNEKLKKENNLEVVGNDVQYQEGIIEILERNSNIDLIIVSELLSGQIGFKELIEKIREINKKIEIIVILKSEKEEIRNYLISKGIFNIFYNNKITNEELINKINSVNKKKKENDINEEIKNLKNIILEKDNINKRKLNIKQKKNEIRDKILKKFNIKNKNEKKNIISIVGTNGIGKSIFSAILAKTIKNKKILLIDFDIFNQSINSIFNIKRKIETKKQNNIEKEIVKTSKNIHILCAVDILFGDDYKIKKDEVKEVLKEFIKKYDLIIIDTTSECFFDYTKELLQSSNLIIFLTQSNLIELKKSKNLLNIYINEWNIQREKIKIVFNKENINSVDNKVLRILFSDFEILGKIKLNSKFDLIINNNLKIIDNKIKKNIKKIFEKCNL